ncbi:T9SS type A sorting domain-containing protein [Chryseobacterium sp. D764]|uniref:T9SS type A sorting domain-containing protein n=1 Tax=unclassified Chryseobacterium TaxID=2593645 RepID=UPI000986E527|nr:MULTISPECIES: T9SS type A sorting domain-containing protein [unclassified Chryseobacterium]QXU48653.1 T9SS type A sorting domain-containing protein [Chryseobacterium sp. D764]CAD0223405.1 T9SS C-terminal target domain-containing protein [Chryseobacterium sp. JV274]
MRKSLFAIGLLAISYSVQAQILCHVDTNANMYVSEGTLVYSGGGVQTKGNGLLDVHGNIMVVGSATDSFKTIDAGGADKTDGGNIILRLNTPASFATSTYGQLYIDGLSQSNISGIVTKEYRTTSNGTGNYFQQVALPFSGKAYNSLSTEVGKTFNTGRYDNPILKWDNANAVSITTLNLAPTSTTWDASGYYMLKVKNNDWNPSAPASGTVFNINGKPYAPYAGAVTLQNAGKSNVGASNVVFGTNGNALNQYNEKYNTYLDDSFEFTTNAWSGTFGQNFYQFGNPFLTNLDLANIGYTESVTGSDGNAVKNIWGIEYDPGTIVTLPSGSTYATSAKVVTFLPTGDGVAPAIGDVDLLVIKPMQSFKIKLRDNTAQTLNFNTLRRFKSTARTAGINYDVTAARMAGTGKNITNTVKQLGVIGLDANGKELSRTYYVVSPSLTTGHQISAATSVQSSAGKNIIGTFEESLNGGYDNNYTNYWLYINEANESNFQGKNVKLVNYYLDQVKSYKFEIRENAVLIPAGAHQLSSGLGFYYKAENGNLIEAKQGDVIAVTNEEANLYYGEPSNITLAVDKNNTTASRTLVVYDPSITNYIVRFDPKWKKADIQVYDMSGKLVISKKAVDASRDFVIELDGSVKNSYVVKIVSDKGETVNTKILK